MGVRACSTKKWWGTLLLGGKTRAELKAPAAPASDAHDDGGSPRVHVVPLPELVTAEDGPLTVAG